MVGKPGSGLGKGKETGLWRGGGNAHQNGLLATEGGIFLGVLERRASGFKLSPCTFSPFLPARLRLEGDTPELRLQYPYLPPPPACT